MTCIQRALYSWYVGASLCGMLCSFTFGRTLSVGSSRTPYAKKVIPSVSSSLKIGVRVFSLCKTSSYPVARWGHESINEPRRLLSWCILMSGVPLLLNLKLDSDTLLRLWMNFLGWHGFISWNLDLKYLLILSIYALRFELNSMCLYINRGVTMP